MVSPMIMQMGAPSPFGEKCQKENKLLSWTEGTQHFGEVEGKEKTDLENKQS